LFILSSLLVSPYPLPSSGPLSVRLLQEYCPPEGNANKKRRPAVDCPLRQRLCLFLRYKCVPPPPPEKRPPLSCVTNAAVNTSPVISVPIFLFLSPHNQAHFLFPLLRPPSSPFNTLIFQFYRLKSKLDPCTATLVHSLHAGGGSFLLFSGTIRTARPSFQPISPTHHFAPYRAFLPFLPGLLPPTVHVPLVHDFCGAGNSIEIPPPLFRPFPGGEARLLSDLYQPFAEIQAARSSSLPSHLPPPQMNQRAFGPNALMTLF